MEQIGQAHYYRPQLLQMIQDRAVIPHFQSIRNLSDDSVAAYEVLGRGGGDDLPSSPTELLDIAAELGCAGELSSLFREEGIRQAKRLDASPQLFLNTHPLELLQMEGIEQSLNNIRKEAPSIPVILEISEKAATQSEQMNRLRVMLKDLDIGLAYDDFGVGQTRLVELAELPPNFLKFDMSIICNIHLAPNRLHQMVNTFINAAHEMGTATIAEGIENEHESEKCKQLGFDYAQGYFYDKPQPISHLLQ
jgi:EAL domain-containing protein (putative c-di-GMP-specific phosphodiesterase class I)